MIRKPTAYVASPYSKGDMAMNVHFQCKMFEMLMNDDIVIPIVPLWSHFQHTIFPRKYEDWINYDQSLLHLFDCCLRLDAELPEHNYYETSSSGADAEAAIFIKLGKPVFSSVGEMYIWASKFSGR